MRVCMFLYGLLGNDSRVLRESAALISAGHDVTVIAMAEPGLPEEDELDGIRVFRIDTAPASLGLFRRRRGGIDPPRLDDSPPARESRSGGPSRRPYSRAYLFALRMYLALAYRRYCRLALHRAREEQADLWIGHDLVALPPAARARRELGGLLLYDTHELWLERDPHPPESWLARRKWRRAEARLIRDADQIITPSPSYAAELARRYGIEEPKVIRNVPALAEQAASDGRSLREDLGASRDQLIALYLGGLQANRGLEQLIECAPLLDERCVVAMVGGGEPRYASYLRDRVRAAGVESRVRILPPVPPRDVVSYAREADLGLAPIINASLSYYLTLPNKLFEYIAAGLALVGSDFPEIGRLINGRHVGITCDPEDPAELAAAINSLVRDDAQREEMRQNAREAGGELNWDRESADYLRIVSEMRPPACEPG
jgi:glycosyltransferase involved in cell wall biosynthesis